MKKVTIITGPGGSGKTTIANLLVKRCGYKLVDGDREDTEFFPDGNQWLPENLDNLKKAHNKILQKTKKLFKEGNSVVVDYIVFNNYIEFFSNFRQAFKEDLKIVVLFPAKSENIKRDAQRECWTTGTERIEVVRTEFESIKKELGADNYIDTSGLTPDQTFEKYFMNYCTSGSN